MIDTYHVDGTTTVVLNDLVRGVVRTTTDDPGLGSSLVVLDGDCVLADVLEPDKLKSAVPVAVDALSLVLANDGVLQGTASLDVEDRVLVVFDKWNVLVAHT